VVFLMPDVSSNNFAEVTQAAAEQIAKAARALMVKSTEGTSYTFGGFHASEANARAAGLKTVAYHFVDNANGVDQARHMWSVVQHSGVSALCIDWEQGGRQIAVDMLHELKALAKGKKIRIGAYEGSWARGHGGGLAGCDFVIVPDYGVASLPDSYKLKPYAGWQYTDGRYNGTKHPTSIPGIGRCDVSLIERPELIFGKPRIQTPRRKPKPAPKPPKPAGHNKAATAKKSAAWQRLWRWCHRGRL
jgi:GH25 family lysozyme M1 (1,4-beta-N-acetylmuramidase)